MKVEPYLNFDGRCEEAIEFYKKAIGAKVEMIMRNDESPEPPPPGSVPPGGEKKILHASLLVGDARIMASDGYSKGTPRFDGITLSLSATDTELALALKRAPRIGTHEPAGFGSRISPGSKNLGGLEGEYSLKSEGPMVRGRVSRSRPCHVCLEAVEAL